eukprot:CAMPEP_0183575426 /NCGR_PEP_ID=MMETSP0371-20130417/135569_1 /TAXON_ID=268820 /ORGANISM="Peridinium aciculiferum, Strain PAER-2" /LENGTH=180 /DNA_ID=CAMNT_0025785591 /DNA_START=55 /DNA_END=594 /DNA_ORIENTATION=+
MSLRFLGRVATFRNSFGTKARGNGWLTIPACRSRDRCCRRLQAASIPDAEETAAEVTQRFLKHPMFGGGAGRAPDGPSEDDRMQLQSLGSIPHIQQDAVRDPNWYWSNQLSGGPGLHPGKKVPLEVSMYNADSWEHTTHADPSRTQKRKHQINWLAHDAIEKEAEMLDRMAAGRLTKAQT